MPHMPFPGHHLAEGDEVVLPAVRDVWLQVLRAEHQVRLPGRYCSSLTAAIKTTINNNDNNKQQ